MSNERTKLTPPQIARMWGVSVDKIHVWVRSGELAAINAATHREGRPRYLVSVNDRQAFERRRAVGRPPSSDRRKRRRRTGTVEEFF